MTALEQLSMTAREHLLAEAVIAARQRSQRSATQQAWPDTYMHSDKGIPYVPHHDEERDAVFSYTPRFVLLRGGEGSGKTTGGSIKALERIKLGQDGIIVAPDFPHFKKSTWPELRRWIPWHFVIPRQQRLSSVEWTPNKPFQLIFTTGSTVYCGGIDDPEAWDGPNVSWAWFDEARRKKKPHALKVLNGRVRIPGPNGEPPQLWLTTTPRKHWLFDYFGPIIRDDDGIIDDPLLSFKERRMDVVMYTRDNLPNLDAGYVEDRAAGLNESERRVLLEGAWEDLDDVSQFLESMLWWDECKDVYPELGKREPVTIAVDASVSGDCFAIIALSRHPDKDRRRDAALRYVGVWYPDGIELEYRTEAGDGPEDVLRMLCKTLNVKRIVYDPYQLHDMMTRFRQERVALTEKFNQGSPRLEADSSLRALIKRRGIVHDGNGELRKHLSNADAKLSGDDRRIRMVKRNEAQKIDLGVALSMCAYSLLGEQVMDGSPISYG